MAIYEFSQTEDQNLLEQAIGRYLRESYDRTERDRIVDSDTGFGDAHWNFFAEMGLLGLPLPESEGGFGGSLADVKLVMRLFAQAMVVEPYYECVVLAGRLIAKCSSSQQKSRWLAQIMSGDKLIALAHREPGERRGGALPETRIALGNDGRFVNGTKTLVPVAGRLDSVLVTGRDEDGKLVVCHIPLQSPGVKVREFKGIDGHRYGDIILDNVAIFDDSILDMNTPEAELEKVLAYGEACLCAEAVGIMDALHATTVEYSQIRKQFGVPIGSFQALRHRMVDCYTTLYQTNILVDLLGAEGSGEWRRHLTAAKTFIIKHGLSIGHEAIQIHGGMGVTDELSVSHYHKRLSAIILLLGGGRFVTSSLADNEGFLDDSPEKVIPPFEVYLDHDVIRFREEVRAFIDAHLTENIRRAVRRQVNAITEPGTTHAWLECLKEKGWQAPLWPKELGGTGWDSIERFVYEYETGLRDVPELPPMGFRYVGPVIAHFGSEWQKSFFLPRILSGEHYWAQGFSEPAAGSDLVALKTTAVRDGDEFVINGSKMWTTHAHHANWLFCLARTRPEAKPHKGIGFFLIPLDAPGVRIDAIPLMAGPREVNQVFLEDVRVPVTHLVGDVTKGWEYTKFLLEYERGGAVFCGRARSELNQAKELVREIREDLVDNRNFLDQLAGLETRVMALEQMEYRHAVALQGGGSPGTGGSITKLLASELRQSISELMAKIVDCPGLEYQNDFLTTGAGDHSFPGLDRELVAMPRYLNMRAESIYGGSSEVQKEIIAKAVLGLR